MGIIRCELGRIWRHPRHAPSAGALLVAALLAVPLGPAPARASAAADTRFDEIETLVTAADYAGAEDALEKLAESGDEASSIRAYLRLGEIDGLLAKKSEADHLGKLVERYQAVIQRYPSSEEAQKALYRLGLVYQAELKETEKAVDCYRKAISDFPTTQVTANAYMKLAELQENELKDYDEALYTLGKCASDFNRFQVGVDARARVIAILRDKVKDPAKTTDAYRAFIDAYPEVEATPGMYTALADHLLKNGQLDEAIKTLRAFAEKFPQAPGAPEAFLRVGRLYAEKRDYAAEVALYEEYLKKFPKADDAPRIAFEIGEVHSKNLVEYKRKVVDVRDPKGKKVDERVMYKLVRASYRDAIDKYLEAYKGYETNAWGRKSVLAAADIYIGMLHEKAGAVPLLESLSNGQPNTEEGKLAKEKLKTIQ